MHVISNEKLKNFLEGGTAPSPLGEGHPSPHSTPSGASLSGLLDAFGVSVSHQISSPASLFLNPGSSAMCT